MDLKLNRYLMVFYYFRVCMLVPECAAGRSAMRSAMFLRTVTLDDHTCAPGDGLFEKDISDKFRCALACMHSSKCYTVFYDFSEGKCSGCTGVYSVTSPLSSYAGNIHYQIHPSCQEGWTGYMRSCYKLTAKGTFFDGESRCVSDGGHAVYIETSAENEFIKEFLKLDEDVVTWSWYMGMTDCEEHDVWKYYDTDVEAEFLDFKSPDPDHQNGECCVVLFRGYDYQWSDFTCVHDNYDWSTVCEINI